MQERISHCFEDNDTLKIICEDISKLTSFAFSDLDPEASDSLNQILYSSLKAHSVGYELYALTFHSSPYVKMFAYCALHESNKTLLMEAIRKNIKDTSSVVYPLGGYHDEIFEDRISVTYLVLEMTYWGYAENQSITLNEKDIKFVRKEYEKRIKAYTKNFTPYELTLEGKLQRSKFGPKLILPENHNYYYLDKKDWDKKDYGKKIKVTGIVTLSSWFRKWQEPEHGYYLMLSGPDHYIKTIEIKPQAKASGPQAGVRESSKKCRCSSEVETT